MQQPKRYPDPWIPLDKDLTMNLLNHVYPQINHKQKSQISKLSLLIVNCCGVANKKLELKTLISLHNIDLLIGTESHLNDTILNSEIFPPGSLCIGTIEIDMVVGFLFWSRIQ